MVEQTVKKAQQKITTKIVNEPPIITKKEIVNESILNLSAISDNQRSPKKIKTTHNYNLEDYQDMIENMKEIEFKRGFLFPVEKKRL